MKLLIIGDQTSTSALVKKLALDNPEIIIDYIGSPINHLESMKNIKMVSLPSILGNDYLESIITYIRSNHKMYDFIYAHDNIFQDSDEFQNLRNNITPKILCPSKHSYKLEASKLYFKKTMNELEIPTPDHFVLDENSLTKLDEYFTNHDLAVVKLDSSKYPTGHGTWIENKFSYESLKLKINKLRTLSSVYLENYVKGQEISFHVLSNGKEWVYLGSARDYKKLYEDEQGENCTSSGAYSPVPFLDNATEKIIFEYTEKIINHFYQIGQPYVGILYLGVIIDDRGIPNLLEINTRPGNPELSVILPNIKNNLLDNLLASTNGMPLAPIEFKGISTVAVQLLHKEYHYDYPKNIQSPILNNHETISLHFLIRNNCSNNLYACLTHSSDDVQNSAKVIYDYLLDQDLGTYRYRRDIGYLT
jgi:phosphoribosylamine--glycine ligase